MITILCVSEQPLVLADNGMRCDVPDRISRRSARVCDHDTMTCTIRAIGNVPVTVLCAKT